MSYAEAMEAAGAKILAFKNFGSYQGDWWAKVRYQGRVGFVQGSYGSCSGCDAFEAEFGYGERGRCEEHEYDDDDDPRVKSCRGCRKAKKAYQIKLAAFGKKYLDYLYTKKEAIKKASEDLDWDMDALEMVDWLKAH